MIINNLWLSVEWETAVSVRPASREGIIVYEEKRGSCDLLCLSCFDGVGSSFFRAVFAAVEQSRPDDLGKVPPASWL